MMDKTKISDRLHPPAHRTGISDCPALASSIDQGGEDPVGPAQGILLAALFGLILWMPIVVVWSLL